MNSATATLLSRDLPERQRKQFRRGRPGRLQASYLKPFDEIYTSRWCERRVIAVIEPSPQSGHDLVVTWVPRGFKHRCSDVIEVNLDDWFTVRRRRLFTPILNVLAAALGGAQ